MKIIIISDIHDNLVNLNKFLNWSRKNKIEKIICCGDVTNEETLEILSNGFKKEIYLVRGNIELYNEEDFSQFKNINYLGRIGLIEISGFKIGICHEPYLINKVLRKGKVDYIFYGHTHKPWSEERSGVKIYNPGTLGGVFQKATFAVMETGGGEVELKALEVLD